MRQPSALSYPKGLWGLLQDPSTSKAGASRRLLVVSTSLRAYVVLSVQRTASEEGSPLMTTLQDLRPLQSNFLRDSGPDQAVGFHKTVTSKLQDFTSYSHLPFSISLSMSSSTSSSFRSFRTTSPYTKGFNFLLCSPSMSIFGLES